MHASHQWLPVRDATTLSRMAMKAKDDFWPTMLEYDGSTVGRSTMSEASVAKMTTWLMVLSICFASHSGVQKKDSASSAASR